eukprot:6195725-Pleurochrysis_carterae.AAC.9
MDLGTQSHKRQLKRCTQDGGRRGNDLRRTKNQELPPTPSRGSNEARGDHSEGLGNEGKNKLTSREKRVEAERSRRDDEKHR